MHCLYTDDNAERFLIDELRRTHPQHLHSQLAPNWVQTDAPLDQPFAFCRQALPDASDVSAPSINAWADALLHACVAGIPDAAPWRLHVLPCYGLGNAGQNRCDLILKSLRERLQKKRRSLLRTLVSTGTTAPWQQGEHLAQLCLLDAGLGIVSVCDAHNHRQQVWTFPKGEVPVAIDKSAPSRAFSKLVEAEQRLGIFIQPNETCVDLGAAPGSWTYVPVERGARVTSIDRSELRDDLMRHPRVRFLKGDAFKFVPDHPVDWMLCDIIAAPQRSIDLLLEWLRERRAKKFIVSIKFMGADEYPRIDQLKTALPELCEQFYLTRLCANKNEVCAFGVAR